MAATTGMAAGTTTTAGTTTATAGTTTGTATTTATTATTGVARRPTAPAANGPITRTPDGCAPAECRRPLLGGSDGRVEVDGQIVERKAFPKVRGHGGFGAVPVARLEGPHDRLVLAAQGGVAVLAPEAAGVDLMCPAPTPQIVEQVEEDPVAGGGDDGSVDHPVGEIGAERRFDVELVGSGDGAADLGRRHFTPAGRQPGGVAFDRFARLVGLADLLAVDLPDDEAPPAGRCDEAFLFEAPQRVAHRRPADLEFLGERVHHEAGARGDRPAQHCRRDPLVRLFGETAATGIDGLEHRSSLIHAPQCGNRNDLDWAYRIRNTPVLARGGRRPRYSHLRLHLARSHEGGSWELLCIHRR